MRKIRHAVGKYASNPRSKKIKFYHKKLREARAFARKSFRMIRVGKRGKVLRVGCPKGKFKRGRCAVGARARKPLTSTKYIGIARARTSKRRQ